MKNILKTEIHWIAMLILCCSCQLALAQNEMGSIPVKKGIVQTNGLSIAYESFGKEQQEAILLIQGTGAQLILWPENLCEKLASKGYRVIRFDNRDVGLSSKLEALGMPDWGAIFPAIGTCNVVKLPYTLQDMSKDAIGLLDALNIQQAHIVGASMGGAIAQLIALDFPDRTLSLSAIMSSTGNPNSTPGNPEVLKVMGTLPPETQNQDSLVNYLVKLYQVMGSPGYPATDETLKKIATRSIQRSWYPIGSARQAAAVIIGDNCDRRDRLRQLKVPAVIIHGENDPVVHIDAGKELALSIPGAKFIAIKGMGHDLPEALTDQFVSAILTAADRNKSRQ